jgi:hypothetical protein
MLASNILGDKKFQMGLSQLRHHDFNYRQTPPIEDIPPRSFAFDPHTFVTCPLRFN